MTNLPVPYEGGGALEPAGEDSFEVESVEIERLSHELTLAQATPARRERGAPGDGGRHR